MAPVLEIKTTEQFELLRAYIECNDEIQLEVRNMFEIIKDDEASVDEKFAAMTTIADLLFVNPDPDDGKLGLDLERCEKTAAKNDRETEALLLQMDSEEDQFAKRLQSAMDHQDVNQSKLASLLGIGQPAVSMMLQRKCRPQRKTILKLSEALKVDPAELWPGFCRD